MDPDLIHAIIKQESSGKLNAVSHAGAEGLMQVMPYMFDRMGGTHYDDPYKAAVENVRVGSLILNEELERYGGDLRLSLAAYNAGSKKVNEAISKAGSTNFDDITPYLEQETRDYVPRVLDNYAARKDQQRAQIAERQVTEGEGSGGSFNGVTGSIQNSAAPASGQSGNLGDLEEFNDFVQEVFTTPGIDELPIRDQLDTIDDIYNSQSWLPEVNDQYREMAVQLRELLPPEENEGEAFQIASPYLESITGDDEVSIRESAKSARGQLLRDLRSSGYAPEYYGDSFDRLIDQKVYRELSKQKGFVGSTADLGGEVFQGFLDPAREAAAGAADWIWGADETADNIRSLAGGDEELYLYYELDEFGRPKTDENDQPVERWAGPIARGIGNLFGIIGIAKGAAGVAAVSGMGAAGSTLTALGTVGTVNFLGTTGQAYELAQQNGATKEEAGIAALYAAPMSGVNTIADMMLSIRPETAWLKGLTGANKRRAVAQLGFRGTVYGAAANVTEQAGIEVGASVATEGRYQPSAKSLTHAAIGGAIAGGTLGAVEGATFRPPQTPDTTPRVEDAPEAAARPEPLSEEQQIKLAQTLEEFQKGNADRIILDYESVDQIPKELLDGTVFNLRAEQLSDRQIAILRGEDYIPPLAQDIDSVNTQLDSVSRRLRDAPDPDAGPLLVKRRNEVTERLNKLDEENGGNLREQAQKIQLSRSKTANKIRRLEAKTRKKPKRPYSKERAESIQRELDSARDDLRRINERESELYQNPRVKNIEALSEAVALTDELGVLNSQVAQTSDAHYPNIYHNLKREYADLSQRKLDLTYDQAEIVGEPDFRDVAVRFDTPTGEKYGVLEDGNWFVLNNDGEVLTDGSPFLHTELTKLTIAENRSARAGDASADVDDGIVLQQAEDIDRTLYSQIGDVPPETAEVLNALRFPLEASELSRNRLVKTNPHVPYEEGNFTAPPTLITPDIPTRIEDVIGLTATTLQDIAKEMSISYGGTVNAAGIYNFAQKFIAIKRDLDLPTAVHEAGHALADYTIVGGLSLDKDGKITMDVSTIPESIQDALIEQALTTYPSLKAVKRLPRQVQVLEGLSEFLRHYATGQPVQADVLKWYQTDFASRFSSLYDSFNKLIGASQQYYKQPARDRVRAFWNPKKASVKTKAKQWLARALGSDEFRKNYIDKDILLRDVSPTAARTFGGTKYRAGFVARQMINSKITTPDGRALRNYSYKDIFSRITPEQYSQVVDYMVAQRSLTYEKRGIEPGLTIDDAQTVIDELHTSPEGGEITAIATRFWDDWTAMLKSLQDTSEYMNVSIGQMIEANIRDTGTEHGYYLPFTRAGKDQVKVGNYLKGSFKSLADDPLNNLESIIGGLYNQAYRYQVFDGLVNDVKNNLENPIAGKHFRVVKDQSYIDSIKKYLVEKLKKSDPDKFLEGVEDDVLEAAVKDAEALFGVPSLPTNLRAPKGYEVLVLPGAKDNSYYFISQELLESFDEAYSPLLAHPVIRSLTSTPKNILQTSATNLNPVFLLARDIIRNPIVGFRRFPSSNPVEFAWYMAQAMPQTILYSAGIGKNSKFTKGVQRLAEMGVLQVSRFNQEFYNARLRDKGFDVHNLTGATGNLIMKAMTKVADITGSLEQGPRLAAALKWFSANGKSLDDPLTPMESVDLVLTWKHSTTDFTRGGERVQNLNKVIPFARARVAELVQTVEDLRGEKGRAVQIKAMLEGLAYASIGYAANLAFRDEDWFKEMEPEQKLNNIYIPMGVEGSNALFSIPLTTVGSWGYGIGQILATDLDDDDPRADGPFAWAATMMGNAAPLDLRFNSIREFTESLANFTGPLGRHAVEQLINKNIYFQTPIESKALRYEFPKVGDRAYEHTSEFAKWVGDTFPWASPVRVESALRSFLPGPMNFIKAAEKQLLPEKLKIPERESVAEALTDMYLFSQEQNQINFKSSDLFYETLEQFNMNINYETAEERQLRLALQSVQKSLSYTRTILREMNLKQPEREDVYAERRRLFQEARDMIDGETAMKVRTKYKPKAEQLRREKKRLLREEAKKERDTEL